MSRRHVTYTTVQGATVRVMRAGGSVKETLYAASSGSTQVANPMTAGQDGTVSAYVEGSDLVDLLVVAPAADPYSVTDVFIGSAGGGGAAPALAGVSIVRAFPFAFDTPDLLTGHAVWTPAVGDLLLDAWFEITTAWDGTAPTGDIGFAGEDTVGFFDTWMSTAVDMTHASRTDVFTGWTFGLRPSLTTWAALALTVRGVAVSDGTNDLMNRADADQQAAKGAVMRATSADPIKVVVSQYGVAGGDDPGSTQGAATLYLVTATPA